MNKALLLIISFVSIFSTSNSQRVQGTIRNSNGPAGNEVVVSIKPTLAFTATISNLVLAVQIPISVGPRPAISITSMQAGLFPAFDILNADQGDGFYTYGFNCAIPGGSNTASTVWSATEMDILKVNFGGAPVPPFTARLCHYLDGGTGGYALFYVETNLAAINGGVLSDWGNLFYGTGASNGATANGNIGTPNAQYSFTTAANVTLPVKFLGFSAVKKGGNALLTWQIENESAVTDRYEVERSLNGLDYVKFATVLPKNNGRSGNSYDLSDLNISALRSSGVFYYRIKQVDKDGKFIYSEIKNLRLNSKGLAIGVYPNPVRSFANLTIDVEQDADATLSITDASGKQVQLLQMQLFKGPNIKKIKMDNLATGSYMLKVQTATEIKTMAVVKAN